MGGSLEAWRVRGWSRWGSGNATRPTSYRWREIVSERDPCVSPDPLGCLRALWPRFGLAVLRMPRPSGTSVREKHAGGRSGRREKNPGARVFFAAVE